MQVRTYRASGMRDALAKVKAELGPNAIILSTQRLDDGRTGYGGVVEVTATVDEPPPQPAAGLKFFQRTSRGRAPMPLDRPEVAQSAPYSEETDAALVDRLQDMLGPLMEEVRGLRGIVNDAGLMNDPAAPAAARIRPQKAPEPIKGSVENADDIEKKLAESLSASDSDAIALPSLAEGPLPGTERGHLPWLPVDKTLTGAALDRPAIEPRPFNSKEDAPLAVPKEDIALDALRRSLLNTDQARSLFRDPLEQLAGWLQSSEVALDRRESLMQGVRLRLDGGPLDRETVESAFIQELLSRVEIKPRADLEQRRIIAFVGPTGVGKTTSLAKIAAEARASGRRQIGLLTIDTYRIGAVEQLRKYANLLELPLEVAVDRLSLERSLRRLDHCDLILIDTIGRSPRDEEPVRQLADLLQNVVGLTFELCISATTALRDMQGIIRTYRHLAPESVMFTKLDEAFAVGPLLSSHLGSGLPMSYFTTGQSVPEDIEHASVERLLGLIVPLVD